MDNKSQKRIAEQRHRREMGIGGVASDSVDKAKFIGTEAWCHAMGPVEEIITKRARLPEGFLGSSIQDAKQVDPIKERGLRGER